MLSFFLQNAPSFLILGLAALGALFLRALAEHYARKDGETPPSSAE